MIPALTPITKNDIKGPSQNVGFGMSGGFVNRMDGMFSWVQATRTREMLVEDAVGMAAARTFMDAMRQYFFKETALNKREINYGAARERLFRELLSIVTDNISGGVIGVGVALGANKLRKTPNFATQFMSKDTLGLFQSILPQSQSKEAFLKNLAKEIAPQSQHTDEIYKILSKSVAQGKKDASKKATVGINKRFKATKIYQFFSKNFTQNKSEAYKDAAVEITKRFKADKTTLDIMVKKNSFMLDGLIEDAAGLTQFMEKEAAKTGHWGQQAMGFVKETHSVSKLMLPLGLGFALLSTLLVPYFNHLITRRVDGVKSYPGEKGLVELKKVKHDDNDTFYEHHMPYLTHCVKTGKVVPLVLSTIPILAFFLLDTVKLSTGQWRSAVLNPFKLKEYGQKFTSMLQFGKGFPFTTQQQMASCYAFLIFSRLLSSRTENEFRERFVDSLVLGWTVWILATPMLKRFFANSWDKTLLKKVGDAHVLKRRIEVERLIHNIHDAKEARKLILTQGTKSTLGKFIVLSGFTTLATMAILGIVEPYIAMKWTEYRAHQKARYVKLPFDKSKSVQPRFTVTSQSLAFNAKQKSNPFKVAG